MAYITCHNDKDRKPALHVPTALIGKNGKRLRSVDQGFARSCLNVSISSKASPIRLSFLKR